MLLSPTRRKEAFSQMQYSMWDIVDYAPAQCHTRCNICGITVFLFIYHYFFFDPATFSPPPPTPNPPPPPPQTRRKCQEMADAGRVSSRKGVLRGIGSAALVFFVSLAGATHGGAVSGRNRRIFTIQEIVFFSCWITGLLELYYGDTIMLSFSFPLCNTHRRTDTNRNPDPPPPAPRTPFLEN